MKFLIDNNLSPKVAEGLLRVGHDAVHVRDRNLAAAPDDLVLDTARVEGRDQVVGLILANLEAVADDLSRGAIVVLGEDWVRVRALPIIRGVSR
jgi:predicted nuclease of predicted toxin-antitoxin system